MIPTEDKYYDIVLKDSLLRNLISLLAFEDTYIVEKVLDFLFDLTDIDTETFDNDDFISELTNKLVN